MKNVNRQPLTTVGEGLPLPCDNNPKTYPFTRRMQP